MVARKSMISVRRSLPLLLIFAVVFACGAADVVVTVDPASRLAGATLLGEWATAGNLDGWAGASVTGLSAAGGLLAGDDNTTGADASVSRTAISGGPDLDLGFNDYLQIRLKLPAAYAGDVRIEFGTSVKNGFATDRRIVIPAANLVKDGAFHAYRLDLGLVVWWRDTLRDLRLTPLLAATGHFEIDYVEVGDEAGTAPVLNTSTNFEAPLTAANTSRLASKHVCVWWDPADTAFTTTQARRALRMCEESYQVYCRKLGYNEPFREFDSTTTTRCKVNFVTWYDGYWAGGYANRAHLNIGAGGLGDEGWGNPAPHEFAHCVQMAQPGRMVGMHWESHANYLRAQRNLHFYATIPSAVPALDNDTYVSNYRVDHHRLIYSDQRYYLSLDDYGTAFGLPANYAAASWRDGARDKTIIEKLAAALPAGTAVKDVAAECCKHWPMLDFVEKTRIRAQHWGSATARAGHFWRQGAILAPQQDKPGWWRVPFERAPEKWSYMLHDLSAATGATVTVELRGFDLSGTGEDWRWCLAAISAGDAVRYSSVWAPGTQSFALTAAEKQVFLIVTATPGSTALDLDSQHNTKPMDKHADRLRYGYEVRLVNAAPAAHGFGASNPTGWHAHGNGGGVVGPSATVAATAYVGPRAKVIGSAQVSGSARIEDYAVVQGSAVVKGSAVVSGFALVDGTAVVQDSARVRDRAELRSGTVKGRALVAGYTRIESATVQDDAVVRGNAYPFGGTISGTAIADHDYSMDFSFSSGAHFGHVPWGAWYDAFYTQTLRTPRGLTASYGTRETSGQVWWDEFGALHALLRGSPARTADAALATTVLSLDGVDDYAVLDRCVADTPDFSFAAWVKADAPVASAPILFLGASATKALRLVREASGIVRCTLGDGATTATLTSLSTLPSGAWRHLAVTVDGGTAGLYVNGILEASAATTLTTLAVLAANDHLASQANYVGRDWEGRLFDGAVGDVRFYNVALTAAEVRGEYRRCGSLLGAYAATAPVDFNGSNSTAETGVRNGRIRTLAAWVKPRTSGDVSNYEAVFDSDDERGGAYGCGFGLDGGKWIVRLDGLGNWSTGVSATLNAWQHVALACNGSSATFFVNGAVAATRTYTGPASDSAAAGKCYRIGFSQTSEDTATRQYFDGYILNARVYDRALAAASLPLDADGDGLSDANEADAGRNPIDPFDALTYNFSGEGWFEGWNPAVNLTNAAVSGGALKGVATSTDPQLSASGLSVTSAGYNYIVARLKASANGPVEWRWGRVGATGFSAARSVTASYSGGGDWENIVFRVGNHAEWAGQVITSVRLNPIGVAGASFEVDSVRPVSVNATPTISGVASQTVNEDSATVAIPFTVGDDLTAASSLSLGKASSNPTLVPTNNIVFGGSGANRTVTVTPAANESGTATLTLTVSDGTSATNRLLTLTVQAVNDAPTIGDVANRAIDEDTSTGAIPITLGDVETAAGSLILGKDSSNPTLVPTANIVFGGGGPRRTVTVTPAANESGTATIALTVSDGTSTTNRLFTLTVHAVNDAPTIGDVASRAIAEDTSTGAIPVALGDAETAAGSLTLGKESSNPTLVPTANIVFGGGGPRRTVTVTPAANESGTATIALTVSDGTLSASDAFTLTVQAVNDAPVLAEVANRAIGAGRRLTITNVATDIDLPAQSLTFSLLTGPDGAALGASSGILAWRPAVSQADPLRVSPHIFPQASGNCVSGPVLAPSRR